MRIALYVRVSTLVQVEKGNSVPEQKKRLQAYCESRGWDNYDFFVDPGHSGSNMDRPALQKLIASVTNYDMVLVYKLDRLSRNQRDILYLIEDVFQKNNVDFNSITENFDTSTPVGKLMLSMMGAFAELERQQINERMMMGRIASANKGRWRGGSGVPSGYIYKKGTNRLEIDETKAPYIVQIYNLFEEGYSYSHIYEKMAEMGFKLSNPHRIRVILSNATYKGCINYAGEIYPGNHKAIISEEQFDRVQQIIKQRDIERNYPSLKQRHLLTGFLYCSCGSRACYHKNMQRGKAYEYYECYSRMSHKTMAKAKRCTNKIWRKADLEEEIWNVLEELEYEDIKTEEPDLIKPKEKELKTVEKQIEKLMDLYLIDGIPQDTLVTRLNALNQKKETLCEEITTLKNKSHKMTATEFKNQKSKLSSIRNADLETQRAFIGSLIESITLLPGHDLKIKWRF